MKIVSSSSFKGGTGKTTSRVKTAAAQVKKGKRFLLADLDLQAPTPRYLDLDPEHGLVLYGDTRTDPAVIPMMKPGDFFHHQLGMVS